MAELTPNAIQVLNARYLHPTLDKTPEDMFRRVAKAVDMGEGYEEDYFNLMDNLEFLPNSPTLMNAGVPNSGTLSACFVLPLEDTMEDIMDAAKSQAMVQKFGGGTGFSLSKLRPAGDSIATTHGAACGPVAVLRHLSSVSRLVTQGGKRDGANMAVLDVSHPDIREFISCKEVEGEIHNFNISVGVSDKFMEAVQLDRDWELINPRTNEVTNIVKARDLWNKITEGAWRNGEPGIIFLDQVNREHDSLGLPRITATNPCGEQPLLPNESCNLGSINVSKFLINGGFDYPKLERVVRLATRFLDNVIDVNVYATPEIEQGTKYTRKIGLGVMGWADALIALGVPYDSQLAVGLANEVFSQIRQWADNESVELAKEKGPAPALHPASSRVPNLPKRRNVCTTTIAPTGTISMIADCSSGIEPVFALGYVKKNILGTGNNDTKELRYINKYFEAKVRNTFDNEITVDRLLSKVANGATATDLGFDWPEFRTAGEISAHGHIDMQAAFQAHCDSGVSKTINLPFRVGVEDVSDAYLYAWQGSCKGMTVYRSGSREKEVLAVTPTPEQQAIPVDIINVPVPAGGADDGLTHIEEGCTGPVVREEGCLKCHGCGISAC